MRAASQSMRLAPAVASVLPAIAACEQCEGYSGADLNAVMYSAQLEAVHEQLERSSGAPAAAGTDSSGAQGDLKAKRPPLIELHHFEKVGTLLCCASNTHADGVVFSVCVCACVCVCVCVYVCCCCC